MRYKIFIEENEPLPGIIIDSSTASTPSGFYDGTSIENWDNYGLTRVNDYAVVKFEIKDIVTDTGWSNLTNAEKDLAIKYYSYPDPTSAVVHLMTTKGWTQQQAEGFVLQSWHKHHLRNIKAYTQRWNYAKFTVLKHLSRDDGEDLFNTVKPLIDLYISVGVLGYDFSDNQDGIYDYVHSIHGYVGQGLQESGYTLLHGDWDGFKSELDDVLVWGVYDKYDDSELE